MKVKELFEKIGYEQKIHTDGIQYIKRDEDSEMERVGRIWTRYIEFYFHEKQILICSTIEHRNGTTSRSDGVVLTLEEFNAVQKQVEELEW